jgi:hypothetical protein
MLQPDFQIPPLFGYVAVFLWALSGAIVGMHKRYDWRTHPILPPG